MDQTKSIELQKKRLKSEEERARARASSACAQTLDYCVCGTVEVYVVVFVKSLRSFYRILSIEPRSVHVMHPPHSFEIQGSSDYDKGIWIYTFFFGQTVFVSVMKLALISSLSESICQCLH